MIWEEYDNIWNIIFIIYEQHKQKIGSFWLHRMEEVFVKLTLSIFHSPRTFSDFFQFARCRRNEKIGNEEVEEVLSLHYDNERTSSTFSLQLPWMTCRRPRHRQVIQSASMSTKQGKLASPNSTPTEFEVRALLFGPTSSRKLAKLKTFRKLDTNLYSVNNEMVSRNNQ